MMFISDLLFFQDLRQILEVGIFLLLQTLWNVLLNDVKSASNIMAFRRQLKPYLFKGMGKLTFEVSSNL